MKIKFYRTRGSLPTPLSAQDVQDKMTSAYKDYGAYKFADENYHEDWKRYCDSDSSFTGNLENWLKLHPRTNYSFTEWLATQPFYKRATYGGETSCCVVSEGDTRLVFDMGSGLRKFGNDLLGDMFKNKKGYDVHFFMSHIHWDSKYMLTA